MDLFSLRACFLRSLGDLSFRLPPDCRFETYSYRKYYAKTLLVEFKIVKVEFSPASKVRS